MLNCACVQASRVSVRRRSTPVRAELVEAFASLIFGGASGRQGLARRAPPGQQYPRSRLTRIHNDEARPGVPS